MSQPKHSRRYVRSDFWVNEKTASLSLVEKAIFLWGATAGHFTCIHRASERTVRNAVDRSISIRDVRTALAHMDQLGLIVWDEDEEIVFVVEGLDEQIGEGNDNPKMHTSAAEYLGKIPTGRAATAFLERYPRWSPDRFGNGDLCNGQARLLPLDYQSDWESEPQIQIQIQRQIQRGVRGDPEGDADASPPREKRAAARQVPKFKAKARAREVFAEYETMRVAHLGGNVTQFTDDHYRVMQQTVRYIQQERDCDQKAAWDWLERFGKAAIDEAVSPDHSAEWADRLRKWRAGPSAWSKKRYQAVMAAVDARGGGRKKINGQKRKVKHDDITGRPYFVDQWGNRTHCNEHGLLPGEGEHADG